MRFTTITEALLDAPEHRVFVTRWIDDDDARTFTFGEFRALAKGYAAYYHSQGLREGDGVVLILPQGVELMAAFAGAMLGGILPAILAYPNRKIDPEKFSTGLLGVTRQLRARLIVTDDEFPPALLSQLVRDSAADAAVVRPGQIAFNSSVPSPVLDASTIAFIQHSAGTTGLQKGVALSHGAVLRQLENLVEALQVVDSDRIYSWLPMYHDMGLIAGFMLPLAWHLPLVLQDPLEWVMQPSAMLRAMSAERATLAWVPNFALQFMARRVPEDERASLDLSSVRAIVNCSEPVRAASLDEFHRAFGPVGLRPEALQASYAMAENTFAVTQTNPQEPPPRIWVSRAAMRADGVLREVPASSTDAICLVSSGRCLKANSVRVVDADRQPVTDGCLGELEIRSDSLFGGYVDRPDLTATSLKDGWYCTGDVGCRIGVEHFVVGRKRDLIVTAGINIYPEDVEEIAYRHPAIQDGRAIALAVYNADAGTDEVVVAAEVGDPASLERAVLIAREIRQDINVELGVSVRAVLVKPPRWIVKSSAGKPARRDTRARLIQEHPELVAEEAVWRVD